MGEKGSKQAQRGQQWGKNLQETDMEKGGRRPPFIGLHESNRWQPTNYGTTAQRAVGTTATGAVLPPYGTTGAQYRVHYRSKQKFYGSGCGSSHGLLTTTKRPEN